MYSPKIGERICVGGVISNAALDQLGRGFVIREATKQASENLLHEICKKYLTFETYQGFTGQRWYVDCYVLERQDYHRLIAEAYQKGMEDALRSPYSLTIQQEPTE